MMSGEKVDIKNEPLELTGSTKMDFYIALSKAAGGEVVVTEFRATNVEFQYEFVPETAEDSTLYDVSLITDSAIKETSELTEEEILKIKNVFEPDDEDTEEP